MNEAVDAHIAALDPRELSAAEISGDLHAEQAVEGVRRASTYPEFDLCAPLTEERRFDVVICEQVLEHVPTRARRPRTCAGSARPAAT